MKTIFGIMSAVHAAPTVDQLVHSLRPFDVAIHHDFGQQADFSITAPNARFVADPRETGWAVWGFTEGIFHLLRHCLQNSDFEYFQLLSPTCLPIKPVDLFVGSLSESAFDANMDVIDLRRDQDALMNYGMRAFAPDGSFRFRILKKCFKYYYGRDWRPVQRANLQLRVRAGERRPITESVCEYLVRAGQQGYLGSSLLTGELPPHVGGTWFGAKRDVCEYLVSQYDNPEIQACFSRLYMADEMMIATLLANSDYSIGPTNHLVNRFTEGNPNWLEPDDLGMLQQSESFFARKFPDDPQAEIRQAVINMITKQPVRNSVA